MLRQNVVLWVGFSLSFFLLSSSIAFTQNGIIRGRVVEAGSNRAVPFANIVVQGTNKGTSTNEEGQFELRDLAPGFTNLVVSSLGYKTATYRDVLVTNAKPATVEIVLEPSAKEVEAVTVESAAFNKTEESPVSVRTIGIAEIERNPGGNRDISQVIKSLPGVASIPTFRNDIIIRGGAPNENRFYLDGVEVPLINHFQTQGASGGPVGIINVNLIREVNFLSGAFPAARGNALSSVLEFTQVDGSSDRKKYRFALGSSDAAFKTEGPLGNKATGIFSFRASYLQFLFRALQLPFLPTYFDWQYKVRWKLSPKSEILFMGLASLDRFRLNLDQNKTEEQRYILRILPVNYQWSYTVGAVYRYYTDRGRHDLVLSRNMFHNRAFKYADNVEKPENLLLDYLSRESENKLRYEYNARIRGWKINAGLNAEHARYTNFTYQKLKTLVGLDTVQVNSTLHLGIGGLFGQVSRDFFNSRLTLSLGMRSDFNTYSTLMMNPLATLSPRFSASFRFSDKWAFNANVGRYFQRPSYTLLGFADIKGRLVNKSNNLRYIRCDHAVAGLEFNPGPNSKVTLEGFWKNYRNYPFSLRDSLSLANQGSDFGVVGNTPADARGFGRAYGLELLAQQKLFRGFYGILAYTFVRSEFSDKMGRLIPSAWDNRHILSMTGGYKLKRNWELGMRWRFAGGLPFTPYDTTTSLLVPVYDITGQGILDVQRFNTLRGSVFHQLDVRVDKVWYLKKFSLNLYLDIQNLYNFRFRTRDYLDIQRDAAGQPVVVLNSQGQPSYLPRWIPNTTGTVVPTLGLIVDF
ncbi:MAG: TonB-dependent receptor [Flavobacteriales bacterium]|nr:TonB-dependent receptor [Flavobacteriales bacterium]MDW8432097.1 TonB-dependent receptor [Flavobacteriales bacterium]